LRIAISNLRFEIGNLVSAQSKRSQRVRQWRSIAAAFLVAVAVLPAPARDSSAKRKTVLVLGDSLSEGFRLSPRDAWPSLVAQRLRKIDPHFHLVNASVSGSTSADGLRRLSMYRQRPIDVFIVELGINDAFLSLAVDEIRDNLQTIIEKVHAKNPGVAIVVVGMQFPLGGADDDYVTAFGRMFAELAEKNHAALVPYLLQGVGGDPALNLEDRIHPNAAGHKILADNVWLVLEPVAREVAARFPNS
jgi:acyl-CoA thioesterase-1